VPSTAVYVSLTPSGISVSSPFKMIYTSIYTLFTSALFSTYKT